MPQRGFKRNHKVRTVKHALSSVAIGENEEYAAELADLTYEVKPALIASVTSMPWFDEKEPWPWNLNRVVPTHPGKTRVFTPKVVDWIEARASEHPLSHPMYNGGAPSVVLAVQAIRRMLGIAWNGKTKANLNRYRAWRESFAHFEASVLAKSGAITPDEFIDRVLKND